MFCGQSLVIRATAIASLVLLAGACSSDNGSPTPSPDGGEDAPSSPGPEAGVTSETGVTGETGPLGEVGLGPGTLVGTVTDPAALPVLGAKIEVGPLSAFSDAQGKYTLAGIPAGAVTVKVTQAWFQPFEQVVAVAAAGTTPWNAIMTEMPLRLDSADQALVNAYNQTFDWTKQTVAIAIAPRPTRCAFDNAVYLRNPALYRDTSAQAPITPAPPPQITAGAAAGFTFPIISGANKGQEALDLTTMADAITGTPLGPTEPADYMVWKSMVNWLMGWNATKSVTVKLAGLAVQQQGWGSNVTRPQDIEKVFVDPGTGRLWVKVVFEPFVQLGPGIADDDGDGRKEVYAALGSTHYTAEIVDALVNNYMKTAFNTHGLSRELSKSLDELYSTTAAKVEGYIGQPFTLPELGTFVYPFVVLRHSGGQKNVVFVAPGP